MKDLFKVGDTVYHWSWGQGKILGCDRSKIYCWLVKFTEAERTFRQDGVFSSVEGPSLSFTPYDLVSGGFSQVRPRPEIKPGQLIYVKDYTGEWRMRYFARWDGNLPECYPDQGNKSLSVTWSFGYSITNPLEE